MADIIRLHVGPHQQVQELLPWYVNGTLDDADRAQVEAHLADCAECRAELAHERPLAREVAAMPVGVAHDWAAMRARIDAAPAPTRLAPPVPFVRRKVPVSWMLATPLAAAAAFAFAVMLVPGQQPGAPGVTYRALGSAPVAQTGNALVMFTPEARDADIRAALTSAGARVVDGPTASGAWVVRVAPDNRDKSLATLRNLSAVTLAEPVDASPAR
jgi:anti-sigma factor RsiW